MRFSEIGSTIRRKIHKACEYYRLEGFWHTFIRISLVFVRVVFKMEEQIFYEINLFGFRIPKGLDDKWQLLKVKEEDIENTSNYFDGWYYETQALRRLEQGHILLAIKANNKFVYMNWIELKNIYLPDINLRFSIPDATVFDASQYTVPEYRNQGIASWANYRILEYLQGLGYKKVFVQIPLLPEKKMGHTVAIKGGYKGYQTIYFWRFFFFLKCYSVKDCGTAKKRVFWRIRKTDQEIWKTFSKIEGV